MRTSETFETLKTNDQLNFYWSKLQAVGALVNELFPEFDWRNFPIETYKDVGRFRICLRGDEIVGVHLSRVASSLWDPAVKTCYQDLLWARSGTRAAYLLMSDFIDFGKSNAQHLIMAISGPTNVKPKTLERLGFKKFEETWRMSV